MYLSVKSIPCTSYWASNSFAKELICHLVIFCFGYILGLIQAFDISVSIIEARLSSGICLLHMCPLDFMLFFNGVGCLMKKMV
jgi:hypothetical protein